MSFTAEQQAVLGRPPTPTIKVLAGPGCGKTADLGRLRQALAGQGV